MNSFCCAEEFFLNDDVDLNSVYSNKTQDFSQIEKKIQEDYDALQKRLDEAQNKNNEPDKSDTLKNQTPQPVQNTQLSQKEKEGFFSSLINKFKKDKKDDEPKRGYYGELPDISREFQYKKPAQTIDRKEEYKVPTLEELNSEIESEKLKQAPLKDALFLDNILKKEDTTSEYLKDIQKTKYALLNLKKCIEENGDIQRFNACVNMLDLLCINFEEKYLEHFNYIRNLLGGIENIAVATDDMKYYYIEPEYYQNANIYLHYEVKEKFENAFSYIEDAIVIENVPEDTVKTLKAKPHVLDIVE